MTNKTVHQIRKFEYVNLHDPSTAALESVHMTDSKGRCQESKTDLAHRVLVDEFLAEEGMD